MAQTQASTGTYNKKDGSQVEYSFEYQVFDDIQDAIDTIGDKVLKHVQRMVKIDANNVAREKAKVSNGDSVRQPMSEEQKAQAKTQRQSDKKLLDMLRNKGVTSISELESAIG